MAKKKTTRKKAAKSAPRKKTATKKKVTKKATSKKVAKKSAAKKAPAKKAAKKTTKKKLVKKTTKKKLVKKATKKKVVKKTTKKKVVKKAAKKTTAKKPTTSKKTAAPKPADRAPAKPAKPVSPEEMTLEQAMEKDWTIPQLKRVKTGLKKKDLKEFLQLLLEKRAEIIGNVQGMEDARNASLGDIAHMPLHMADVGTDNYEQEFTLGLMEFEREMLAEINEALERIRDGYYGVCLDSGRPINRIRLENAPWSKYCIEVARLRESRGW